MDEEQERPDHVQTFPPDGRLRRAARWLFAQAPERAGLDADDAPWTAEELAQLAETFTGADHGVSAAEPQVTGAPATASPPAGPVRPAGRPRPRPRPYAGAPVRPSPTPSPAGRSPRSRRVVRWAVRTGVLAAIVIAAAVLLRAYVVSPYYIPSASMEPTLHGCPGCNDDHVLVDKLSYRMHDIHRGDVVVFHRPASWAVPEKTLIKRVIGLPGDRLAVRDGKLYINGLLLQEPYLNPACPRLTGLGEPPAKPRAAFGPVPLDSVFVMGDNRCDSADSRAFGPVPEADVVGRAFLVVWPFGRIHSL